MSNKVDILKIVRENNEKFKQHLQKIRELEEREKELNYPNLYRNYRKDGLTTISEKPTETCSANKNTYTVDNYDYVGVNRSNNSSLYERGVNINDINDINEEEQVDSFKEDSNYNERVSKEKDYMRINEEYKNNRTDYELSDDDTYDHKTNQELQGDTKKECEVQKREQGTSDESDDDQEQNQPDGGNTDEEEGLNNNSNDQAKVESRSHSATEEEVEEETNHMEKPNTKNRAYTPKFNSNYISSVKSDGKSSHLNRTGDDTNRERSTQSLKKPYTAYTYSSIKKIKEKETKKNYKSETKKKYNGKVDKVASYQSFKKYWDSKPFLANITQEKKMFTEDPVDPESRFKMRKLRNIRKPIPYYTKM